MSLVPSSDGLLTLDDIFMAYEASLQRYALNLVHDIDRADDLVQVTMIRAMANLGLLEQLNPYKRRAWLYKVLKNHFIDEERARTRQARLIEYLSDQELVTDTRSDIPDPRSLLEQVPKQYRELLHEHYIQGRSTEEIACELDIPSATVRSRLFLARKWLRAHRKEIV